MASIILGVSGIARDAGRVLLARRGRGPYAGRWSLPGGKVEPLEPHREALVREFKEETGLEVVVDRPAGIAEAIRPEESAHYVILSFFVTVTGGTPAAGDDAVEMTWVAREELASLQLTPLLERYLQEFGAWD